MRLQAVRQERREKDPRFPRRRRSRSTRCTSRSQSSTTSPRRSSAGRCPVDEQDLLKKLGVAEKLFQRYLDKVCEGDGMRTNGWIPD